MKWQIICGNLIDLHFSLWGCWWALSQETFLLQLQTLFYWRFCPSLESWQLMSRVFVSRISWYSLWFYTWWKLKWKCLVFLKRYPVSEVGPCSVLSRCTHLSSPLWMGLLWGLTLSSWNKSWCMGRALRSVCSPGQAQTLDKAITALVFLRLSSPSPLLFCRPLVLWVPSRFWLHILRWGPGHGRF